jgi:hypothetical protein
MQYVRQLERWFEFWGDKRVETGHYGWQVIGDFHCSTGSGVECYKQREIADDDHLHYASHSGGMVQHARTP